MNDNFYRAFEDKFRGSTLLIQNRMKIYLPFIEPLYQLYPNSLAIDIGCGRGEWLGLLKDVGFNPSGVDLDGGMLAACIQAGYSVYQTDGIEYLSRLPDESQTIVSAFHVVEHIKFAQLMLFVSEAMRVLKPGGILIMETPNPENIIVATCDFYTDPTHQRPIPSTLLAFVAEYTGFARVKTLRLQESKELLNKDDISLSNVFAGVSPDYAIVAQKHASEDVLEMISQPFNHNYGLSLVDLLSRWEQRFAIFETKVQQAEVQSQDAVVRAQETSNLLQEFETKVRQAEVQLQDAVVRVQETDTRLQKFEIHTLQQREADLVQRLQAAENRAAEQELRAIEAEQTIQYWQQQASHWHARVLTLYASTSWFLTKPLRTIKRILTGNFAVFHAISAIVKLKFKQMLSSLFSIVKQHPPLFFRVRKVVMRSPRLFNYLQNLNSHIQQNECQKEMVNPVVDVDLNNLSSSAKIIYRKLKKAAEIKNKDV